MKSEGDRSVIEPTSELVAASPRFTAVQVKFSDFLHFPFLCLSSALS